MATGDPRCPACGRPSSLVWVHGHGQCAHCGQNVAPCCSGAGDEVDARERGAPAGEPPSRDPPSRELETLLELLRAGGSTLRATLLNRFAARTGHSLDDGARAFDQALATGRIHFDHSTGVVELAS